MPIRRSAVAMLALVLALGAAACGDDEEKKTLVYTESQGDDSFNVLDNPPRSNFRSGNPEFTPGDQVTFSSGLLDGMKPVGRLDAVCALTGTSGRLESSTAQCTGTATIPGGTLTLSLGGKVFADETTSGAITGGTGEYAGARGTFSSEGEENAKDTFEVTLPDD